MNSNMQRDKSMKLKCPNCGETAHSGDLVPRYTGPERGFEAKFMCPSCWKDKKVTLDSQMERICQC